MITRAENVEVINADNFNFKKDENSSFFLQKFMSWKFKWIFIIPLIGLFLYWGFEIYLFFKMGKTRFRLFALNFYFNNIKKHWLLFIILFLFSCFINIIFIADFYYYFPIIITKYNLNTKI